MVKAEAKFIEAKENYYAVKNPEKIMLNLPSDSCSVSEALMNKQEYPKRK